MNLLTNRLTAIPERRRPRSIDDEARNIDWDGLKRIYDKIDTLGMDDALLDAVKMMNTTMTRKTLFRDGRRVIESLVMLLFKYGHSKL